MPLPDSDAPRLRWLVRRVAADDRGAFAELYRRCSGPVLCGLRQQLPDQARVAGVLAGTFVEVWWLAGAHTGLDNDVLAWIDRIVQRRVADSRPAALSQACAPSGLGALRPQTVEVELAELLERRLGPLECEVRLCRR